MVMPGLTLGALTILILSWVTWHLAQDELDMIVHLIGTLVWAFWFEMLHAVIMTVRTEIYYETIWRWMNMERVQRFWARLGHPINADWDRRHPAVPCIVYIIKLVQIHVETIFFSGFAYWIPTTAFPSLALKPVYLPMFVQTRPIYDSSAAQWVSDMLRRLPREIFLSSLLFYVGLVIEVHRRARARHSEVVGRRYRAFVSLFHDVGARVLAHSYYQALYPVYLLLRPLCGLKLIPLLNGTTFLEAYRQTATGCAVLDPIVAVLRAFLGPGNLWPTVYSVWLLVLGVVIMLLVAICFFILWTLYFPFILLIMACIDLLLGNGSYCAVWDDLGFYDVMIRYALRTLTLQANFLQLVMRDTIPYPRLYTRDHFLPNIAPAERAQVARATQIFLNACGLWY